MSEIKIKHKHVITYHLRRNRLWNTDSTYLQFIKYEDGAHGWYLMEEGGLGRPLELKWSTGRAKVRQYFKDYPFVAQVTVVSTTTINKIRS